MFRDRETAEKKILRTQGLRVVADNLMGMNILPHDYFMVVLRFDPQQAEM